MKTQRRTRKERRERGVELFELALILPFLLVLVAGVVDFAQAWNVRQILANAARDGARLGASQTQVDLTNPVPSSVVTLCEQVADYLNEENVNLAFMNMSTSTISSACASPTAVKSTNGTLVPQAWTYYSSGTSYGLKIERTAEVPSGCGTGVTCISATRVTLDYPFNWSFGFNHIVNLIGVSNYPATVPIGVYSTMPNLWNAD
jgi:Flp pilus assembly protein TadG